MPTPPQSYSAAAAEKLRLALLALAASAATVAATAQDVDDDPVETVTLGEIPEDVIVDGEYMCTPCPKESCPSEDCFCEDACVEGKPCTDCDTPSSAEGKTHAESAEDKTHAESAEGSEAKSHAETTEMVTVATIVSGRYPTQPAATNAPVACRADNVEVVVRRHAEGAEEKTHAESAEGAEKKPHAESAEGAESGEGSGEAEPSPSVAPAAATNAVQALARAMSEKSGYPVSADLVVAAAKRLDQDPEEYARKMLEEIGAGAASTNAPTSAPSDRLLILGRRR